ncbi:MAG: hypothetical protein AB8B83_07970 [Bdellovibrionales bacterium]
MRLVVLLFILAGVAYFQYSETPHKDGLPLETVSGKKLAPEKPVQKRLIPAKNIQFKGAQLSFTHEFEVKALVLSTMHYGSGHESRYSRVDLALGWGAMSNPNVLRSIQISQSNRFYYFSYQSRPPVAHHVIARSSANMHMVAANQGIENKLKSVKNGDVVHIRGFLTKIKTENGWRWKSSTTRNDTGAGACELVYVNDIKIIEY